MKKYYWTMKNGQQIDVDDMDITHLRNTLKMILRNVEAQKAKLTSRKRHHIELQGDMAQQFHETYFADEEAYLDSDEFNFINQNI